MIRNTPFFKIIPDACRVVKEIINNDDDKIGISTGATVADVPDNYDNVRDIAQNQILRSSNKARGDPVSYPMNVFRITVIEK